MKDDELITLLGGVDALATELRFTYQRVANWKYRKKIPATIKIAYPKIFLSKNPKPLSKQKNP